MTKIQDRTTLRSDAKWTHRHEAISHSQMIADRANNVDPRDTGAWEPAPFRDGEFWTASAIFRPTPTAALAKRIVPHSIRELDCELRAAIGHIALRTDETEIEDAEIWEYIEPSDIARSLGAIDAATKILMKMRERITDALQQRLREFDGS